MLSPLGYSLLVMAIIFQRLLELNVSTLHAEKLINKGAYEIGEKNYFKLKIVHTLFFCSLTCEALWHFSPPGKNLIVAGLIIMCIGQVLRMYSMALLGERWTTKIFVIPGYIPIRQGPYFLFNHPTYLSLVLELFALPMLGGLWWTAGFFFLTNLYLLLQRVKLEHQALALSEKHS